MRNFDTKDAQCHLVGAWVIFRTMRASCGGGCMACKDGSRSRLGSGVLKGIQSCFFGKVEFPQRPSSLTAHEWGYWHFRGPAHARYFSFRRVCFLYSTPSKDVDVLSGCVHHREASPNVFTGLGKCLEGGLVRPPPPLPLFN